jgi:hypothetical protein
MKPNSTSHLITKGLGYCCPGAFFALHPPAKNTAVADRLGVSISTVRRLRAESFTCPGKAGCIKDLLAEAEGVKTSSPRGNKKRRWP